MSHTNPRTNRRQKTDDIEQEDREPPSETEYDQQMEHHERDRPLRFVIPCRFDTLVPTLATCDQTYSFVDGAVEPTTRNPHLGNRPPGTLR